MKDKGRQYLIDKIILLEKENTILRKEYRKVISTLNIINTAKQFSVVSNKIPVIEGSSVPPVLGSHVTLPIIFETDFEVDELNKLFHTSIVFKPEQTDNGVTYRAAYAGNYEGLLLALDRHNMIHTIVDSLADAIIHELDNYDIVGGRKELDNAD